MVSDSIGFQGFVELGDLVECQSAVKPQALLFIEAEVEFIDGVEHLCAADLGIKPHYKN